jgi:hypothetical protein
MLMMKNEDVVVADMNIDIIMTIDMNMVRKNEDVVNINIFLKVRLALFFMDNCISIFFCLLKLIYYNTFNYKIIIT